MASGQTSGATPRLSSIRLEACRLPSMNLADIENVRSPTGKSPRPPEEHAATAAAVGATKVPRREDDVDAASSSRLASVDESHETLAVAFATGDESDCDEPAKEVEDDKDSSDEEDALSRMVRVQQQQQRPSPAAQSRRRSSPRSQPAASPAAAATPPAAPAATEEGWDAVGSSSRRRSRGCSTGTGASPATPTPATPAPPAALPAGGDESDGDDGFDAYSAAKDASRRRIGKHGRSVKLAAQRQYAVDARHEQRAAGRP